MVLTVLLGISHSEIGESVFEGRALAHVAGENHCITRASVRPRQSMATEIGIALEVFGAMISITGLILASRSWRM